MGSNNVTIDNLLQCILLFFNFLALSTIGIIETKESLIKKYHRLEENPYISKSLFANIMFSEYKDKISLPK